LLIGGPGARQGRLPTILIFEGVRELCRTIDAPEGGELLDICDEHLAPVPFSCRSASCATCQVEVVEGAELLEPPSLEEQELLELLGGPANNRLACQARIRPGLGRIRLKPIGT
jgi:ferredoxin